MTDTGDTPTEMGFPEYQARYWELSRRTGVASWHQLWAAVDNLLVQHQPRKVPSIDALNCEKHHPLTGPRRHTADTRSYMTCPDCVVTTVVICTGRICCSWPCEVIEAVQGALGQGAPREEVEEMEEEKPIDLGFLSLPPMVCNRCGEDAMLGAHADCQGQTEEEE